MTVRILVGDVRQHLADLPDASVHCVVTSPPYWRQREHVGVLDLGGSELDVYVLSNGTRVISLNKVVKAITDREGGNPGEYIGVSALKPFIDKDLVLGESFEFEVPGTQFRGRGITAESFLAICQGYVAALQSRSLTTERQTEIAIKCSILLGNYPLNDRKRMNDIWGIGDSDAPPIQSQQRPAVFSPRVL